MRVTVYAIAGCRSTIQCNTVKCAVLGSGKFRLLSVIHLFREGEYTWQCTPSSATCRLQFHVHPAVALQSNIFTSPYTT